MPAMYESALVGKRQEILDDIFNVEAASTPLLSSLSVGGRPKQLLANWVAEVIPAVASTGILDGTAATNPQKVDRYQLTGCGQHFRREWGVTTLADLTNSAGVGTNEAGHQMLLAMLLLKRMIEQQFSSNDDSAEESGATPWTTRGAFRWLHDSAQTTHAVDSNIRPASGVTYSGALASLDESGFRDLLEAAYAAVREPLQLVGQVDATLKAIMDDWTNVHAVASTTSQPRVAYQVRDNNAYKSKVDYLSFSVGSCDLMLNDYLLRTTSSGAAPTVAGNGLFLKMAMWDVGYMMKPANTNLAPDGSGKKGFVDAVALLRCKNPRGQCRVMCSS